MLITAPTNGPSEGPTTCYGVEETSTEEETPGTKGTFQINLYWL